MSSFLVEESIQNGNKKFGKFHSSSVEFSTHFFCFHFECLPKVHPELITCHSWTDYGAQRKTKGSSRHYSAIIIIRCIKCMNFYTYISILLSWSYWIHLIGWMPTIKLSWWDTWKWLLKIMSTWCLVLNCAIDKHSRLRNSFAWISTDCTTCVFLFSLQIFSSLLHYCLFFLVIFPLDPLCSFVLLSVLFRFIGRLSGATV